MKTERRHELQTNELAQWLTKELDWVKPYAKTILAVVIAAAAVAIVWVVVTGRSQHYDQAGWNEYYEAAATRNINKLQEIANKYGNTPVGAWAMQAAADAHLATGTQQLFVNRDLAETELTGAINNYLSVLKMTNDPLVHQRAMYGLAKSYEGNFNLEEAKNWYKQVADKWPDGAIGQKAQQRYDELSREGTVDFYAWYKREKPRAPRQPPLTTPAGVQPRGPYDDLPDDPGLSLPGGLDEFEGLDFSGLGTGMGTGNPSGDGGLPGTTPDSTTPDTTTPDTTTPDSTTPDTTTPTPDSGTPDSGTPDSGTTPDAGTSPDSGTTPPSGTSPDGGASPDATTPPAGTSEDGK